MESDSEEEEERQVRTPVVSTRIFFRFFARHHRLIYAVLLLTHVISLDLNQGHVVLENSTVSERGDKANWLSIYLFRPFWVSRLALGAPVMIATIAVVFLFVRLFCFLFFFFLLWSICGWFLSQVNIGP